MLLRVVLLLEILLLVTANSGEKKRFCGQHLTETLQYFCRNRYASPTLVNNDKRSGNSKSFQTYTKDWLLCKQLQKNNAVHKAIYFYNKKKSGKIFEVNDLKKKIIFDVKDV